jgi:hypothetical protein
MTLPYKPIQAPRPGTDPQTWMNQVCERLNALLGSVDTTEPIASLHAARTDNPHSVTAEQVGAVDNSAALAAEAAARASADSLLSGQITSEAATRLAADSAETAARIAGDAANSAALAAHEADTSTHGVTEIVGRVEAQTLSTKILDATNKFGGAANYTMFEADGTPVAVGNASTYDDSQAAVIYMRTGGTALTLDVIAGGIYAYRFDQTDEVHSQIQLSHRLKVGTPIYFHVHLVNKAAVGATNYNVGIEVEWGWHSIDQVMPAPTVEAVVPCSFQNASALTHKVFPIVTITPTAAQGGISSLLFMRVKRVAAASQNLSGNNIFMGGIDVHNQQDTPGSREEYIK